MGLSGLGQRQDFKVVPLFCVVVCGVCQRSVGITARSRGSTNRSGTVKGAIVTSRDTAKQTILRITIATPTIVPKTAIGGLTESCMMPGMDHVGLIWHKRL